jgi:heme/copper-type cytochrome/quinol oxidase subunit 3
MAPDPKRIAREWNREIEAETRRQEAGRDEGRWKIVVWVALEVMWFVLLFAMVGWFKLAQW